MVPEVRASPSWLASWAPPETRLGALQRGRGDGFRMALSGGLEAAAEVVGCVLDDPRWDRQVESRDSYYARLLLALGGDLGPIAARLAALAEDVSNDSANLWLPLGVTSELAARGHVGAVEILADLVASTRLWEPCLDALEGAGGPRLVGEVVSPEIAAALVARLGPAELREAIKRVGAPWATWAETIPDLRPALAEFSPTRATGRGERPAPSGSIDRSLSVDALLRMDLPPRNMRELAALVDERRDVATTSALLRAATAVGHPSRVMALQLLGRRGYVELLGDAAAFLRDEVNGRGDPRLRRGYLLYLQELPAAAVLPLARAWFHEAWPLSLAAGSIFARHATGEDRSVLEAAGSAALVDGAMYRLCDVLEALEVIGDPASIELLCRVVWDVPYSYARQRALAALVPHVDRAEVDALLTDALWDCEPDARWIACEQADLASPWVRARLEEIASDIGEDEELRERAREINLGPGRALRAPRRYE